MSDRTTKFLQNDDAAYSQNCDEPTVKRYGTRLEHIAAEEPVASNVSNRYPDQYDKQECVGLETHSAGFVAHSHPEMNLSQSYFAADEPRAGVVETPYPDKNPQEVFVNQNSDTAGTVPNEYAERADTCQELGRTSPSLG